MFLRKKIIKISLRKGEKSDYVLLTEPLFYDHLLIYIIIKIIENSFSGHFPFNYKYLVLKFSYNRNKRFQI